MHWKWDDDEDGDNNITETKNAVLPSACSFFAASDKENDEH